MMKTDRSIISVLAWFGRHGWFVGLVLYAICFFGWIYAPQPANHIFAVVGLWWLVSDLRPKA